MIPTIQPSPITATNFAAFGHRRCSLWHGHCVLHSIATTDSKISPARIILVLVIVIAIKEIFYKDNGYLSKYPSKWGFFKVMR